MKCYPLASIRHLAVAGTVSTMTLSASAQYRTIATLDQLDDGGFPATNLSGGVVAEGSTVFAIINNFGTSTPRIVSFDDANPGDGPTTVVTTTQYQAANPGDSGISSANYLGLIDGNLIYTDIGTDALFASDVITGITTQRITNASLETQVGGNARFGTLATGGPGDILFYDNFSDGIYSATGGIVTQQLSDVQLTAAIGDDTPSGLTVLGNTAIVGDNNTDAVYSIDLTSKAGTQILSTADITAVTGETAAGFLTFVTIGSEVFFYDIVSDSILSFDSASPSSSLAVALSDAQLAAGPANTSVITGLFDFDGQLGFYVDGAGDAVKGIYAVPEPTSLALLGLGGLALLRRRTA